MIPHWGLCDLSLWKWLLLIPFRHSTGQSRRCWTAEQTRGLHKLRPKRYCRFVLLFLPESDLRSSCICRCNIYVHRLDTGHNNRTCSVIDQAIKPNSDDVVLWLCFSWLLRCKCTAWIDFKIRTTAWVICQGISIRTLPYPMLQKCLKPYGTCHMHVFDNVLFESVWYWNGTACLTLVFGLDVRWEKGLYSIHISKHAWFYEKQYK